MTGAGLLIIGGVAYLVHRAMQGAPAPVAASAVAPGVEAEAAEIVPPAPGEPGYVPPAWSVPVPTASGTIVPQAAVAQEAFSWAVAPQEQIPVGELTPSTPWMPFVSQVPVLAEVGPAEMVTPAVPQTQPGESVRIAGSAQATVAGAAASTIPAGCTQMIKRPRQCPAGYQLVTLKRLPPKCPSGYYVDPAYMTECRPVSATVTEGVAPGSTMPVQTDAEGEYCPAGWKPNTTRCHIPQVWGKVGNLWRVVGRRGAVCKMAGPKLVCVPE